jgi:dTDP-4-dehydrorhamnose reductase
MAWGTYHFCNTGVISWYQLARKAISLSSRHERFIVEQINPITTAEYPTVAPRPAYSALDCSAVQVAFGVDLRPWEESLAEMITMLYGI